MKVIKLLIAVDYTVHSTYHIEISVVNIILLIHQLFYLCTFYSNKTIYSSVSLNTVNVLIH